MNSSTGSVPHTPHLVAPQTTYTAPSNTTVEIEAGQVYTSNMYTIPTHKIAPQYSHHHKHHYPAPAPYAPACPPSQDFWGSSGYILVLFILLVIISRGLGSY
ncbi:hypothetical protein J2Z69_000283 [Paenibacillus shirakamiensis]|uniref:Uncharacterized protein n=1 Tax=Paenibacillus shirakamiensis TaxID=1265935 RepID=A0ABS4JC20_9BACL|nr:hypothetical protein [Paenibacillus shirakamiensis]MBP1999264.1 hypothetical protein [Paenibacillus shirakamiensis]